MTELRKIRKRRRLSIAMLAKQLKITPQGVSYHDQKGVRKKVTAERYAKILKCDWRDLID